MNPIRLTIKAAPKLKKTSNNTINAPPLARYTFYPWLDPIQLVNLPVHQSVVQLVWRLGFEPIPCPIGIDNKRFCPFLFDQVCCCCWVWICCCCCCWLDDRFTPEIWSRCPYIMSKSTGVGGGNNYWCEHCRCFVYNNKIVLNIWSWSYLTMHSPDRTTKVRMVTWITWSDSWTNCNLRILNWMIHVKDLQ